MAWDLAPHDISIVLNIMGEQPITVNCQGSAHITPGVEDVTTMCLTFPNQTLRHHPKQLAGSEKSPGNDHRRQQADDCL